MVSMLLEVQSKTQKGEERRGEERRGEERRGEESQTSCDLSGKN